MQLPHNVTLNINNETLTINSVDIVLMDYNAKKLAMARLLPLPRPVVLWRGAEYDNVGDYTQAQIETRILEILGPDIQASLMTLSASQ